MKVVSHRRDGSDKRVRVVQFKCDGCGKEETEDFRLRVITGLYFDWQICPECSKIFDRLKVLNVIDKYQQRLTRALAGYSV